MGGGERSYFGFEYQIQASVLFLLKECTNAKFENMFIESPFGHDAEVNFRDSNALDNTDRALSGKIDSIRTVWIQVKTRARKSEWHPSDIRDLLLKTDEQNSDNQNLIQALSNDPKSIFLFITDGIISTSLAALIANHDLTRKAPTASYKHIQELLCRSDRKTDFQAKYAGYLSDSLLDRIYLVESLETNHIRSSARKILHEDFGISYYDTDSKVNELNELVRQRMLRIGNKNLVTQKDIEVLVGKSRGQLPYPVINERFVSTKSYTEIEQSLENKNILIIVGEPGVGKTAIAESLINHYVAERRYKLSVPKTDSAHHEIMQISREPGDHIIFLDDAFGIDEVGSHNKLLRYFDSVTDTISHAKGRLKLIITTRYSVLKASLRDTTQSSQLVERFRINQQIPSKHLVIEIIKKHLSLVSAETNRTEEIIRLLKDKSFENLVHVRHFIREIASASALSHKAIEETLEQTRPSLYRNWLDRQPDESRVFMFMLWGLIRSNYYAHEKDLKLSFEIACECLEFGKKGGFLSLFDKSKNLLLHEQEMIVQLPNGTFSFVHPSLFIAVEEYFVRYQLGAAHLVDILSKKLIEQEGSVPQSLAAILLISFQYEVQRVYKGYMLKLLKSKYVLVRETILRYVGNSVYSLLGDIDPIEKRSAEDGVEANFRYDPYDLEINAENELVLGQRAHKNTYSAGDYSDRLSLRIKLWSGDFDADVETRFRSAVDTERLDFLDPIERYEFGYWLRRIQRESSTAIPFRLMELLANDPYHFVRETVIDLLSISAILSDSNHGELFHRIVTDEHPNVKIAIIEKIIFPNWVQFPADIQEEWLKLIPILLDHPFVRRKVTASLVGLSEHENDEFYSWTLEQKQKWLTAVTQSLLAYEFEYNIDFDNLLSAFDDFFIRNTAEQRTDLVTQLNSYIQRFPRYTFEISSTIELLLFSGNPNRKELDAVSEMINNFTVRGRCRFSYTFARNLEKINDFQLRDFVSRPFFNESPNDFLPERVASVLGFLANPSLTHEDLPSIILEQAGNNDSPHSLVERYASRQDVDFKVLLVLMAYQYEKVHHIPAIDDASEHPFVLSQFTELLKSGDFNIQMLMVNLLLKNIRAISPELVEWSGQPIKPVIESKWFKVFQNFLYSDNYLVAIHTCKLIIANCINDITPNVRISASLIYLILNHPQNEIVNYAFCLFDNHFSHIWDIIENQHLPEDWITEIDKMWRTPEFLKRLWENSAVFKVYVLARKQLAFAESNWPDLSNEQKDKIVAFYSGIASDMSVSHLVKIAKVFLGLLQEQLTEDQIKILTESIYVESVASQFDLRWRLQELEKERELESEFPKFDWSRHFSDE